MSENAGADVRAPQSAGLGRYYILLVLCVVGVFNQLDRQIINIVLQPIKVEFHASDTAMGLLTGMVFAAFYAVALLPIARLLDRHPRKFVLAGCLTFWSLMTSLGGFTQSFLQLAITRIGVATAESGAAPTAYSMLSDLFKVTARATAIAVYTSSQCIGIGLGIFLGGWLSETFNWRESFMIVGVPGLLLAAIVCLTVREPKRGHSDNLASVPPPMSTVDALRYLFKIKTYRWIMACIGLSGFVGYGLFAWGPTYLIRVHHMTATHVGIWFGLAAAGGLIIGNMLSGFLGDYFGKRDMRAYMWVAAAGVLLCVIPALVFVSTTDWRVAIWAAFFLQMLLTFHIPGCYSMGQTLAPLRARATASGLMGLSSTIVGTGIAPLVIGMLNDALHSRYGDQSLRYSLTTLAVAGVAAALAGLMGAKTLREDYANRHDIQPPAAS